MAAPEITRVSWFSRLGRSLRGIIGGLLLFALGIVGLAWNEGRAVRSAKGLAEGASAVVEIPQDSQSTAATQGKLVHLIGKAHSPQSLQDPQFAIEVEALRLRRQVEMLQWRERTESKTKTVVGGGTETTTTHHYEKIWSDRLIDSQAFKEAAAHANPPAMPLESAEWTAEPIQLGNFRLGEGLVAQLSKFEEIPPPESLPEGYSTQGNVIFKSANPVTPQVGDLRITFKAALPAEVSVVARQSHGSLDAYPTTHGTNIEMLAYGSLTAEQMFRKAEQANKALTWGLRILGFIVLFMGMQILLAPLAVLADVLPPLGRLTRMGTSLLAALIALPAGVVTIAIAWLAYRPLLGGGLLLLAIAIPAGLWMTRRKTAAA
jgi:hypothetical protein